MTKNTLIAMEITSTMANSAIIDPKTAATLLLLSSQVSLPAAKVEVGVGIEVGAGSGVEDELSVMYISVTQCYSSALLNSLVVGIS